MVIIKSAPALLVDEKTIGSMIVGLASMVEDIAMLRAEGKAVVVVPSGAIALGQRGLPLTERR